MARPARHGGGPRPHEAVAADGRVAAPGAFTDGFVMTPGATPRTLSGGRIGAWLRRCRDELAFWRRVLAHPDTPRSVRWLVGLALMYLAWPIDLVPDWIPLLGQLDDIVLVGLALWLALRLLPAPVLAQCRAPA